MIVYLLTRHYDHADIPVEGYLNQHKAEDNLTVRKSKGEKASISIVRILDYDPSKEILAF